MEPQVKRAVDAFQKGHPVCLFDSEKREGETDLLFPAAKAEPAMMRQLRQDCGGLLFLAIGDEVGECFGLPFLQDIHTTPDAIERNPVLNHLITNDLRYDARSAFTLSINHRETYTGITPRPSLDHPPLCRVSNRLFGRRDGWRTGHETVGRRIPNPRPYSRLQGGQRRTERQARPHRTRCGPCSPRWGSACCHRC